MYKCKFEWPGGAHIAVVFNMSWETWEKLVYVNFWGVLHHVYAFLPSMKARRSGHIVNVSTGQAFFRLPTWGAYASVKAGMAAFSDTLHFELRKHGIAVTTVYPFMAMTSFYDQVAPESWGGRLSMRLRPYYSQKPETIGRIIVRAVARKKRQELVHVANDLGYVMQVVPVVSSAVGRISDRILAGRARVAS